MDKYIAAESNRLKQVAGQNLQKQLIQKFDELIKDNTIKAFSHNDNFSHAKYQYKKQYLANFVITTLDDKYIVINSSNSFRQDRVKQQSYDLEGVKNNSPFSEGIIASILLYPDNAIDKDPPLAQYRDMFSKQHLYSPATHILLLSELLVFLENHKTEVENEKERQKEEGTNTGSFYAVKGNAFEKSVVVELNRQDLLEELLKNSTTSSNIFNTIVLQICNVNKIKPNSLISINAKDNITKLKLGGNAKTDVLVKLVTRSKIITETISIKTTTRNLVSCHEYKASDFIRVLKIDGTKLADYFNLFQKQGSYDKFEASLPEGYSGTDFESLLSPYILTLSQWALKGQHDQINLIKGENQISNYLLINQNGKYRFVDYDSYIQELFKLHKNKKYGVPFSWTYPSKKRGERIQLKMPIRI